MKFWNKYRVETTRLQKWDYGWNGFYYITICTANRKHYFGKIVDGKMQFSEIGEMAKKYWDEIPQHFPFVKLDAFIIMPDHVHEIIVIDKPVNDITLSYTISSIIGSYKSVVSKYAHKINPGFAWQSRFYDHIIRNEKSLKRIMEYIINNPSKWNKGNSASGL